MPTSSIARRLLGEEGREPKRPGWLGVRMKDSADDRLLHAAVNGQTHDVALAIDAGADVNLDHGAPLRWAASNGHANVVNQLLDAGARIDTTYHDALSGAAKNGFADVVAMLLDAGADPDVGAGTPLQVAIGHSHSKTAKLLIDRGADVTRMDHWPLRFAQLVHLPEVVLATLKAGADPSHLDPEFISQVAKYDPALAGKILRFAIPDET